MPRSRSAGGRSAPSRPTVASKPAAPAAQQTRPATTAAAPHQQQQQPQQAAPASQGPGLMGQMASTAAGVAIGSSVGHAIGGFFGGGSSEQPQQSQENQVQATQPQTTDQGYGQANNCGPATQQFTKCMDDHQGNMQICNWYLEQLKACQSAASQY